MGGNRGENGKRGEVFFVKGDIQEGRQQVWGTGEVKGLKTGV